MGTGSGVVSVAECGSVWDGCSPRPGIAHHQRHCRNHIGNLRSQTRHALEEVRLRPLNLNHVAPGERGGDWFATRSMSVGSRPVTCSSPCNLNPVAPGERGLDWFATRSMSVGSRPVTCSSPCNLNPAALRVDSFAVGNSARVERRLELPKPSPRSTACLGQPRPPSALELSVARLTRRHPASTGAHISGGGPPRYCPGRGAGGMAAIESANSESMAQRDTNPAARPLSHAFLRANRRRSRRLGTAPRPIVGPAGGRRHATTRTHWSPVRLANPLASRASGGGGPKKGTRWEARTANA